MALQLPGNSLQLPGNSLQLPGNSLQLPRGTTLKSLYQINNQSIWFLTWILKKVRFWPDLAKVVLEEPFTVKREYWPTNRLKYIVTEKNNLKHGFLREWYKNGQLRGEYYLKNDMPHGLWKYSWTYGTRDVGGYYFCLLNRKMLYNKFL